MPRIGVTVTTDAQVSGAAPEAAPASTFFVAGITERGDVDAPVLLRSMSDYKRLLGPRVAYGALFDSLTTFFAEGGSKAYVARAVGPAATVGTLTLVDRAGAPIDTLRIDAKDPGPWSQGVTIEVTDGIVPDSFNLLVREGGEIKERYDNLLSPADAIAKLTTSGYVRATNLASATAAPNNNPAVMAPTALSAGADDRGAVTFATMITALDRFGSDLGAGMVAIPGQSAANVATGVIAHARATGRVDALAPTAGSSVSSTGNQARALRNIAGAEHAGFFAPWVQVPDGAGGIRTISPEGYVAGLRARAHLEAGPWKVPAGEAGKARYVLGVEQQFTRADIDSLADDHVNVIRQTGSSVRLYGYRSLSTDFLTWGMLTVRDLLNHLAVEGERRLERFVFRTIDGKGHLFAEAEGELLDLVEPIRKAGGLYERRTEAGEFVDPGYLIDTGPGVNTDDSLARNEMRVALFVRPSPTAELIRLTITRAAFRSDLRAA
jgi:phage tail sheath protein FI